MSKAEELKQAAKGARFKSDKPRIYSFTEEELQQYADEVSRERAPQFLVDYAENYVQDFHSLEKAEKYYNNWIKEQEEKK